MISWNIMPPEFGEWVKLRLIMLCILIINLYLNVVWSGVDLRINTKIISCV